MNRFLARARRITSNAALIVLLEISSVILIISPAHAATVPLTINGAQKFQTMDGFGTNINTASWKNGEGRAAIDQLIAGGTTLWRVIIDNTDWEAENDDADPNNFNWASYNTVYSSPKFQDFWNTVAYLNSKGFSNGIILNFMGPGPSWLGRDTLDTTDNGRNEWVEMISSLVYYGRNTAHVQFGLISPVNEPDWQCTAYHEGMCISASVYADIMNRLSTKLDSLGISDLHFVGADTASVSNGLNDYMPAVNQKPALMTKWDHYGFHDYNGDSANADSRIKSSAYPTKDFWMDEVSQFSDAFANVGQGAAGILTWDGYDAIYNHPQLHGALPVPGNDAGDEPALLTYNSGSGVYTPRKGYYQFEQLFKYVPAGSVRVAATQSASGVTTYAFTDPLSGRVTIVGNNLSGSSNTFNSTLTNIATAVPGFEYYTTGNSGGANFQRGSDIPVVNGTFSFTVPANTVFTLTYAGNPDVVAPSAPTLSVSTPNPAQAVLNWSASTDDTGVTGYDIFRGTTAGFVPAAANKVSSVGPLTASYTDTVIAGTYYYKVQARDAAANVGTSNEVMATVQPDVTAPTAPTGVTASALAANRVDISWSPSADNVLVNSYTVLRDGAPMGTTSTTAYSDMSVVANTTYVYTVVATDTSGNVSLESTPPASVTTPSTVPLTAGTPVFTDQTTSGSSITSPTFTAHSGDLVVAFLSSDGPAGTTQSFNTPTTAGLTWTLRKRTNASSSGTAEIWTAVAPAGFTSGTVSATRISGSYQGSITVVAFSGADTNATAATASASGSNSAPSVSLTTTRAGSWVWGVGDDWANVSPRTVGVNQTMVHQYAAPNIGAFWTQRQNSPTALPGNVTLNDTAPSTSDKWNLAAIEILPMTTPGDTTPPVLSTINASASDEHTATVVWTTNEAATSAVDYGTTTAYGSTVSDSTKLTSHSVALTGLNAGTTYHYRVRSTDAAGNAAVSADNVFVTPDTTAPSVPQITAALALSTTQTQIAWTASTDNVAVANYQVWRDGTLAGTVSGSTNVFADSGLTPGQTYSYSVIALDAAGNASVASTAQSVTLPVPDTAAPEAPANLAMVSVGLSTATFSWDPASDNVGVTSYQIWRSDVSTNPVGTVPASSLSFTDNGLQSETTYTYTIKALDAAGNISTASAGLDITTLADLQAPTTPGNLLFSNVSANSISLSWSGSTDNIAVANYQIWRSDSPDGGFIQVGENAIATPFTDSGLQSGGTYYYFVRALDAHGNYADSITVSVATTAPDTTPPPVPANVVAAATSFARAHITWNASLDSSGIAFYTIWRDGSPLTTVPGSSTSFDDNALVAGQTYSYAVAATDNSGNASILSAPANVTLPSANLTAPAPGATISGTITVSATAPIGTVGVQFLLDGANLGAEDASAPYALSWNTVTATNGNHTLSARIRDNFGNTLTVASQAVTVSNVAATLSVDKQVTTHQSSAANTIVSPSLTTAQSNELLVAFISSDGPSGAQSFKTVTGGGLTWTLRKRTNARAGTAEIWTAVAPNANTSVTVTATRNTGSYVGSITVVAFIGASTSTMGATGSANAASGAPSVSLTTTRAGSQVWAVGNDWDNNIARTVGTGQTKVDEFLASVGDTFWVQKLTNPVPVTGTAVTINDTAPTADRWNLSAIEILPLP